MRLPIFTLASAAALAFCFAGHSSAQQNSMHFGDGGPQMTQGAVTSSGGGCSDCQANVTAQPVSSCGCSNGSSECSSCCQSSRGQSGCDQCSRPSLQSLQLKNPLAKGPATGRTIFSRGTSCENDCSECDSCSSGMRGKLSSRSYGVKRGLLSGAMDRLTSRHGCAGGCESAGCDGGCETGCGCESGSDCGCDSCHDASRGLAYEQPAVYNEPMVDADCGCGDTSCAQCSTFTNDSGGGGGLLSSHSFKARSLFSGLKNHGRSSGIQHVPELGGCGCEDGNCECGGAHGAGGYGHGLECGVHGCGAGGRLCGRCAGRRVQRGEFPHTEQPPYGAGGMPGGQAPSYAYPYYTTRAPRDFLMDNPPSIGW